MKVLITGSLGQLGKELVNSCPSDYDICAIDLAELDITNEIAVNEFIQFQEPDVIINAAAYTAVDKAEDECELAEKVNFRGVRNLACAAKQFKVRLIHISTDYVFDGTSCKPYTPDDSTNPVSVYGQTKLAGEKVITETVDDYVIVRTSWLYSSRGNNFVKTMLRLMSEREELGIVADQVGTPTSAHTLANTVWQFVQNPTLKGIYHWSDAGVASWYDFACIIMSKALDIGLLSKPIAVKPIRTVDYPTPAKRPAYSVFDKTSTYEDLGIKPEHWIESLVEVLLQIKGSK